MYSQGIGIVDAPKQEQTYTKSAFVSIEKMKVNTLGASPYCDRHELNFLGRCRRRLIEA